MIGWNFPSNNYGQETGLNDAGIETFRGNPWDSLAREIIQNSLDAKKHGTASPVEVHFELNSLSIDKFPDREFFVGILEACREYWRSNTKTKKFFNNALEVIDISPIPVLKISDYNTTGLTGSDMDHGTNWHNLIKSVGVSDKSSSSGGSYGIGKNAPFACSQIRTVFYGTKDCDGKRAFQGVAKLVTHQNEQGETTQGTGYYGWLDRNRPIIDYSEVDEFFHRDQTGTDIFVFGFNAEDGWKSKIIISVLENFFMAIWKNKLVVRVGETIINSNSLPELIENHIGNDTEYLSGKYYNAITSEKAHYFNEPDFQGMGRIELYVLPERDYPKRVAMVRGTGMKIFDKGHFQTPMKFAGVMLAIGEKLNEFLRILEPPSHNNWEHERHDDPKYAKKILNKLKSWVNEKVRSISFSDDAEELEVEGMSQYLPDDLANAPQNSYDETAEGEKGAPKEVEIRDKYREPSSNASAAGYEAAAAAEENEDYYDEETDEETNEGDESSDNDDNSNDSVGGSSSTDNTGTSESDGSSGVKPGEQGSNPSSTTNPLKFKRVRIFCTDPDTGMYNISIYPDADGEGFLGFNIVGEVGTERASVKSAVIKDSGLQINIKSGLVGPIKFAAGKKTTILITLSEPMRCALEVSAYAN